MTWFPNHGSGYSLPRFAPDAAQRVLNQDHQDLLYYHTYKYLVNMYFKINVIIYFIYYIYLSNEIKIKKHFDIDFDIIFWGEQMDEMSVLNRGFLNFFLCQVRMSINSVICYLLEYPEDSCCVPLVIWNDLLSRYGNKNILINYARTNN